MVEGQRCLCATADDSNAWSSRCAFSDSSDAKQSERVWDQRGAGARVRRRAGPRGGPGRAGAAATAPASLPRANSAPWNPRTDFPRLALCLGPPVRWPLRLASLDHLRTEEVTVRHHPAARGPTRGAVGPRVSARVGPCAPKRQSPCPPSPHTPPVRHTHPPHRRRASRPANTRRKTSTQMQTHMHTFTHTTLKNPAQNDPQERNKIS